MKEIVMNVLLKIIAISLLSLASAFSYAANSREDRRADQQQQGNGRSVQQEQPRRSQENSGNSSQRNSPDAGSSDNSRKHGRLTPEERRDLRRQINEAGQDIYLRKP